MKTIVTTLNAKYIHTSLALRWLYVANKERYDISFAEYTIKEDISTIASDLTESGCDIVGIGVYIWNVSKSLQLASELKRINPEIVIIFGGPEVTYDTEYFISFPSVDYVVSGEGEFVLGQLLEALESGLSADIEGVSSKDRISRHVARADIKRLEELHSPYMLPEDVDDLNNRLIYFETSRGCPYSCGYCLSSLEKGMRYFSEGYVRNNLRYLIESGAKQIKFLDRTFNLDKERTLGLFDFLIQNHRKNLSCQFEMYAELLTDDTIEYLNSNLPDNFFRFEIGVQSTYEPANIAVNRRQDFELLASNVRKIMHGNRIDLHLDLIAGLPHETFERFAKSFNDVFALGAKEVQLGFLKMLRGTSLRREATKYGYKFTDNAPYEVISNDYISPKELERIHDAEHALEKFWNSGRFASSMQLIFDEYYSEKHFEFFDELGQYYRSNNYPHHGYQLEDLFRQLHEFLKSKNIDTLSALKEDYYACFNIRPHGFCEDELSKDDRKKILYQIGQDKVFLNKHGLTRKIIEKQAVVDVAGDREFLLTIFMHSEAGYSQKRVLYKFSDI